MSRDNAIRLHGTVGSEPELRFTPGGQSVVNFSMAWAPRKKTDNGWEDGETIWWTVTAWQKLGENVAESVQKGDRVIVVGEQRVDTWTDRETQQPRQRLAITADDVALSMQFRPARSGDKPVSSKPKSKPQQPAYNPDEEPF